MELIEEGEWMDTLPVACHPLKPEDELKQIIEGNKLVLILKQSSDVA